MSIKKILTPIDGSEHAEKALRYALEIAEKHEADVEIMTVVPEVVTTPKWMKDYTEQMKEKGEEMLTKTLRKAKGEKPDINISKRLEEGIIIPKILEVAKKGKHDIIILGSRGMGLARGVLLGSVCSKIVHLAEIPVLIVK